MAATINRPCTVTRVVDGDTFIADVYLGFGVRFDGQRFRLLRIGAPEMKEPGGAEAKAALEAVLGEKVAAFLSWDGKKDRYGRFLVELFVGIRPINVSDELLKNSLFKPMSLEDQTCDR